MSFDTTPLVLASKDYGEKSDMISTAIANLRSDLARSKDVRNAIPMAKQLKTEEELSRRGSSMLPRLFGNIKKNADSILTYGTRSYPAIRMRVNNQRYLFSRSPNFSEAFNESLPSLYAIASKNNDRSITEKNGKKRDVNPCIILNDTGDTLNDFLSEKSPRAGLEGIRMPEVSSDTLDLCGANHGCADCFDCKAHKEELTKSLIGILDDSEDSQHMRPFHIKNLITTLQSWASHHDTKGGTKTTESMVGYLADAHQHRSFSTALRIMAHKLLSGYQQDYAQSNGEGGGIHRDDFGSDYGAVRKAY